MTEKIKETFNKLNLLFKEAIKTWERMVGIKNLPVEYLGLIINSIEKQIPKKPDFEGDGYADGQLVYDTWICPNCEKRYEVDYEEYDHCPNCGQKINWSEVEE